MEADLSAPVAAWLCSRGFEVYTEVPFSFRNVDMVGVRSLDGRVCAIELKTSLNKSVQYQTNHLTICAHEVYAAVGTNPRKTTVGTMEKSGVGVLSVRDGVVRRVSKSHGFTRKDGSRVGPHGAYLKQIRDTLSKMEPGGIGGKPNQKGVGPAADVERAVAEYRKAHPKTTWKEMFAAIPNHYVSAASMCGAMKKIKERRAYREWEKAERGKALSSPESGRED